MWNTRAFRGWIKILIFAGLGIGALAMALPVRASGAVLYAAPGGLTTGACTSWATACTLSYALSIAVNGDQIWVKEGVHKPDTTGLANPRLATFSLKKVWRSTAALQERKPALGREAGRAVQPS